MKMTLIITTIIFSFFYQSANTKKILNCNEVIDLCLFNDKCNEAWKNVNLFCTVTENKCSAKFQNIPKCAKIMDILHSHEFFGKNQKCRCSSHDIKCKNFINKANKNPCFISVKLLRHRNEMPYSENNEQVLKSTTNEEMQQENINFISKLKSYDSYEVQGNTQSYKLQAKN